MLKRPKDMTLTEVMALPVVAATDPSVMRATWYDDDDIIDFWDGNTSFRLRMNDKNEWVRTRNH